MKEDIITMADLEEKMRENGNKIVVPYVIVRILRDKTNEEKKISQKKLLEILNDEYGVEICRNTLHTHLKELQKLNVVSVGRSGVYYTGKDISEGELRLFIDMLLSSPLISEIGKEKITESILDLGSMYFRKNMTGYLKFRNDNQVKALSSIPPTIDAGTVLNNLGTIQGAIFGDHQISFNYHTFYFDNKIQTRWLYPENICVDPYDFVFKNGKYSLIGSVHGSGKIESWAVELMDDVTVLTEMRDPINPSISQRGGVLGYAKTQPKLAGGRPERFYIQCDRDNLDELVEIFGTSLIPTQIPKSEQKRYLGSSRRDKGYNENVIVLMVDATRESMKHWALAHAESFVVVKPADFREEIEKTISDCERAYRIADEKREDPHYELHERRNRELRNIYSAKTFKERVEAVKSANRRGFSYHSYTRGEKEVADLSLLKDCPSLTMISIIGCRLEHLECLNELPELRTLNLIECEYSIETLSELKNVQRFETDLIEAAKVMGSHIALNELTLEERSSSKITEKDFSVFEDILPVKNLTLGRINKIKDLSFLANCSAFRELNSITVSWCHTVTDYSFLQKMPSLRWVSIHSPHFELKDALELKEKTKIEAIQIYGMNELDEETLEKLGYVRTRLGNPIVRSRVDDPQINYTKNRNV